MLVYVVYVCVMVRDHKRGRERESRAGFLCKGLGASTTGEREEDSFRVIWPLLGLFNP